MIIRFCLSIASKSALAYNELRSYNEFLLDGTHLVAVRGLIHQEVPTSASTSGSGRSDAATSDKDKQICLSILPRTGFDAKVCSYLAFHS